ncbi:MAG: flavin reductase family protein [Gammaproteobacteria bacterium]|nr:flavin reductase family protein [Gammaproteobacteria bacterium]
MFYKTSEAHGLPHNPFKSCVAPRPIAWVSSMHPDGAINLAPYSFFNALSSDPPMVMISFNGYHQHGGEKDTLYNIKASGEFVINMVPLGLKDAMNVTTANVRHEVDEFELAGLTTEDSVLVKPPRVREAPIHLECQLFQEVKLPCTLPDSINRMIIGSVLGVHIRDEVLVDGLVDLSLINPLARLGYMQYSTVEEAFVMKRPSD